MKANDVMYRLIQYQDERQKHSHEVFRVIGTEGDGARIQVHSMNGDEDDGELIIIPQNIFEAANINVLVEFYHYDSVHYPEDLVLKAKHGWEVVVESLPDDDCFNVKFVKDGYIATVCNDELSSDRL